jgi:uncharacterized protein
MTLDDALASFCAAGELPRAEMEWALDHWGKASPRFTALLEAYVQGEEQTTEAENVLFITMHLQAEKADTAAFAPLCRLLLDGGAADRILGDAITETLPRVLVNLYDGHLPTLAAVVEAAQADAFIRLAALMAMAYLTHDGQVAEAEMRAHLLRWLDVLQPQEEHPIWTAWVRAVASLGYADLVPQAESLFGHGWVEPYAMRLNDFRKRLRATLDDPSGMAGFADENARRFGRAVEELKAWVNAVPPKPDKHLLLNLLQDVYDPLTQPATNPLRDVGRNDPCPCGSGKKYKKCCLV